MGSTRSQLERAERSAPRPTFGFTDLERRRSSRRTRRKAGTIVVALALATATLGSAFLALRQDGGATVGSTGTTGAEPETGLPPATVAPLLAGPGEYHLQRIRLDSKLLECVEDECETHQSEIAFEATIWWTPDDDVAVSGRIELHGEPSGYGIEEGTFGPGELPNGIDTSAFPTDPAALAAFLLERSQDDGTSPAPLVSPPPGGDPQDGRMWRAITDVLRIPSVTPGLRGALMDVAAGLRGSHVELDALDPAGRPAHVVWMTDDTGELAERIYLDPASHELLAITSGAADGTSVLWSWVIEQAGIAPGAGEDPTHTSIPTAN